MDSAALVLPSLGLTLSTSSGVTSSDPGSPASRHERPVIPTPRRNGGSRRSINRKPQGDLGVLHTSRVVRIADKQRSAEQAKGTADLEAERRKASWLGKDFTDAQRDFDHLLEAVATELGRYLEATPPGSTVVEFGSRFGDFASLVARRNPNVQVQPTEGTGQTPGIFLMLQERVLKHNEELARLFGEDGPRLLQPRYMDGSKLEGWTEELKIPSVSCVFAVNVLQFVHFDCVKAVLQGCRKVLRPGGFLFLAGPFFNEGEISDASLRTHAGLETWAKEAGRRYPDRTLTWGLHDLQNIRRSAQFLGFEVVEQSTVGADWSIMVLQWPLARRRSRLLSRPPDAYLARARFNTNGTTASHGS